MTTSRRPLIEAFDTPLRPAALFEYFRDDPGCFWLDSGMDPVKLGRYSFMGSRPFLTLSSRGNRVTVKENNTKAVVRGNPFEVLGTYLNQYRLKKSDMPAPFTGGAVGYLSYDLGHHVEKLPCTATDDIKLPEMLFGFYDLVLAYDHKLGKTFIISSGFPEKNEAARLRKARSRLDETINKLQRKSRQKKSATVSTDKTSSTLRCNFTREQYLTAVSRARQYIIDGDIFEVNISQRFTTDLSLEPYELYRKLRQINPAPFAAYLDFGGVKIIGASPERFLKVTGDKVETRPIKGTIKRGRTPGEDKKQAQILLASAKDHAENMMIVDLERNDLGRVCVYGSVRVTELAILEAFPTVFHLTSTVTGQLRDGIDQIDLLKATFPGGSITGAPKIRSMEIIDELEPTRRSVYTGNLGYIGFNGDMDLNIVIRTFIIKGKKVYFQVGGAVVYDSDPTGEYDETLLKAKALIKAIGAGNPQ